MFLVYFFLSLFNWFVFGIHLEFYVQLYRDTNKIFYGNLESSVLVTTTTTTATSTITTTNFALKSVNKLMIFSIKLSE